MCLPKETYELRCPNAGATISGYFNDFDILAKKASALSGNVPAVYITINPVKPELLARAENRANPRAFITTGDREILRRTRLMIDCDAERPAGVSSTDEEHELALRRCRSIKNWLTQAGFPDPILADSGNGGHLIYAIDLPNDDASTTLVRSFLEAVGQQFSKAGVNVDQTVFNAARIDKLYGTMSCKGENTPERPHRLSRILEAPDELQVVPKALLEKIAEPAPIPEPTKYCFGNVTLEGIEEMMVKAGLHFHQPSPYRGGLRWRLKECPFADDHSGGRGGAAVFLQDGKVGFKCQHEHCSAKHAKHVFKDVFPKPKREQNDFDGLAESFIESCRHKGEYPLFTDNRMYFYDRNRYVLCEELPSVIRRFFSERGLSQSNNVIGNVLPIVQERAWRARVTYGDLPFWSDGPAPFDVKNVIAFRNGLLDINRPDAPLQSHSPKWCSTFCLPFEYDSQKKCPQWLKFLDQVLEADADRIALLQEYLGYCLTNDTNAQKALFLVGKKRAGKGTIFRIVNALLGKENCTGFSLDRLTTEFGLSALLNKTVALVGEVELTNNPNRSKIVEVLKSIIGEDTIMVNEKHNPKFHSVRLGTRFLISTNALPTLFDSSGALNDRMLFLPFELSFSGREDTSLEQTLLSEISGIANWALAGLKRLRVNNGKFTLGAKHRNISQQFSADTSPVLAWLQSEMVVWRRLNPGDLSEEMCVDTEPTVTKDEAYRSFVDWCERNNVTPRASVWWGRDLLGILPKVRDCQITNADGRRVRSFKGIGVRSDMPPKPPAVEVPKPAEVKPCLQDNQQVAFNQACMYSKNGRDSVALPDPTDLSVWRWGFLPSAKSSIQDACLMDERCSREEALSRAKIWTDRIIE
jgi:P4 family phage/plasmid primase-like protien